jgi:hypothetical protein
VPSSALARPASRDGNGFAPCAPRGPLGTGTKWFRGDIQRRNTTAESADAESRWLSVGLGAETPFVEVVRKGLPCASRPRAQVAPCEGSGTGRGGVSASYCSLASDEVNLGKLGRVELFPLQAGQ